MLDFNSVRAKKMSLAQLGEGLTISDLHHLTDEMVDTMLDLIEDAQDGDVVFVPCDPDAKDDYAADSAEANLAWTLGHVIVHATASSEEAAAHACELARGIVYEGRSRYEAPWESMYSVAHVRQRLEESRRMRHAFLNAWPDQPHLEVTHTADYPNAKPRNAILCFITGLGHDDAHLGHIADIMRQACAARNIYEPERLR
jgi:hypothetical protein